MSDDESDGSRRLFQAAVVILVAVSVLGVAYGAANYWTATSGARLVSDSEMTLIFDSTERVESGSPFVDRKTIAINKTRFTGQDADARIATRNDGTWTNLTKVNVSSGDLFINRSDARPVGTSGTTDAIAVQTLDLSQTTANTDLVATSGGTWALQVNNTGFAQGAGVVVVERDTGKALDAATVDSNGDVRLTDVESVSADELNVRRGPGELKVFNESAPDTLVDGVTLKVRVFGTESGSVQERTVQNGRLDLTGIPSDEPLAFTIDEDSTTDYVFRRTIIRSTTEQQQVYLLNRNNADTAQIVFELQDRTGNYEASNTTLFIEKPITKDYDGDGDEETRYQTIAGDRFGGSGEFTTVLEKNERYRLRIENTQGDSRQLGSYVAQLNDRVTLGVGQVDIKAPGDKGYRSDLQTELIDSDNDGFDEQFVRVVYVDAEDRTEQLKYTVRNTTASTVVAQDTITSQLGSHVATYKVAENETGASYKLSFNASRQQPSGADVTVSGSDRAGNIPGIAGAIPIDPRWASLIGYISIVALAGLVVIADPALGGIVATGWASILTILGIVAIPVPALGLGGAVSVFALLGKTNR